MGTVFEYMILLRPLPERAKEGEPTRIVKDVKRIVAANQNAALLRAARDIPSELEKELDRVDIAIRPF